MNRIKRIRRVVAIPVGLGLITLILATAAPAAFARVVPPGPSAVTAPVAAHAVTRTVLVGGTPGWQIALIAVGAALFAAALAVLADRMRTAHRKSELSAA